MILERSDTLLATLHEKIAKKLHEAGNDAVPGQFSLLHPNM